MLANDYRERIRLQTQARGESPLDGEVAWIDGDLYWAGVKGMDTRGQAAFQQVYHSEATHIVEFRDIVVVTLDMRLLWTGPGTVLYPVAPCQYVTRFGHAFTLLMVREERNTNSVQPGSGSGSGSGS